MYQSISKEMKRYNYFIGEMEAAYHEAALSMGLSDSAMKILYAICDSGEGYFGSYIFLRTLVFHKRCIDFAGFLGDKRGLVIHCGSGGPGCNCDDYAVGREKKEVSLFVKGKRFLIQKWLMVLALLFFPGIDEILCSFSAKQCMNND